MISEADIIKEVAGMLESNGIAYMFTGSIAANFYTVPRMTRDIDIVIELKDTDVERVYKLFEKDFFIDRNSISNAIREKGMFNIVHYKSVFKIDFIVRKNDLYRIEEFKRKKQIIFEDAKLYLTAPEDLILSKLYWAKDSMSELQLNDVKNLLGSVKEINEDYLKRWADYLGISELYSKVRK